MQESFMMSFPMQNQSICSVNGQFMVFPGVHYPICLLNYNGLINYQMTSQNIVLNHNPLIQNSLHQPPLLFPVGSSSCGLTQVNTTTQNGKQQQEHFPQIQKIKHCVKKQNSQLPEKRMKESSQKRGNDRFIKKNTESNVINQIFSFLWTPQKSKQFLIKIQGNEQKIDIFYQLMGTIKSHCKSQLNRFYLKSLIKSSEWQNGLKKLKKKVKKIGSFTPEQLCIIVRKLTYLYLREASRLCIMTSKKMNHQLWHLHLTKCKEIIHFLFEEASQ